jgi:hypothetical protein
LLSISSPKLLDDDLNATMTEILVWAETATTYGLSKTLDAMMKELKKVVNSFPEMITTEIPESMRPEPGWPRFPPIFASISQASPTAPLKSIGYQPTVTYTN